jgi:hypothetical protein
MVKTKQFDGKNYYLRDFSYYKLDAKNRAKALKKKGFLCRIVPEKRKIYQSYATRDKRGWVYQIHTTSREGFVYHLFCRKK